MAMSLLAERLAGENPETPQRRALETHLSVRTRARRPRGDVSHRAVRRAEGSDATVSNSGSARHGTHT